MAYLSHGLDPSSGIGFAFLVLGALYTGGLCWILFNLQEDSLHDIHRKRLREAEVKSKVNRLYPNKKP